MTALHLNTVQWAAGGTYIVHVPEEETNLFVEAILEYEDKSGDKTLILYYLPVIDNDATGQSSFSNKTGRSLHCTRPFKGNSLELFWDIVRRIRSEMKAGTFKPYKFRENIRNKKYRKELAGFLARL